MRLSSGSSYISIPRLIEQVLAQLEGGLFDDQQEKLVRGGGRKLGGKAALGGTGAEGGLDRTSQSERVLRALQHGDAPQLVTIDGARLEKQKRDLALAHAAGELDEAILPRPDVRAASSDGICKARRVVR